MIDIHVQLKEFSFGSNTFEANYDVVERNYINKELYNDYVKNIHHL